MRSGFIAALLAVGLTASWARADDTSAAREHYRKGSSLYDVGRFGEAAQEYEQAYQLKNDPALLFNLGQAYRLNGDYAKAIVAYKSFLRHVPDAPNAGTVQQHIAELQKLVDEQKHAESSPPTGTMAPGTVKPAPEPPATQPAPTAAPATEAAPVPAASLTASAPPRPTPLYKRWWLWTAVGGVLVAGVVVGVAVGVSESHAAGTNLPGVSF